MFTAESVSDNVSASAPVGQTLVAVRDVTKRYGHQIAVEGLDLHLCAGEVFGLVGANGGGKTTTLRILVGILKPDQGRGHVLGLDLAHKRNEIRKHIGYMSQRLSLYADLTVYQNLRFRADVYGLRSPGVAAATTMREFELEAFARIRAGRLSGGWARKLQLAAALIHSPRLIVLDEPTAGLDARVEARGLAAYRAHGRSGSGRDRVLTRSGRRRAMLACGSSLRGAGRSSRDARRDRARRSRSSVSAFRR